MEMTKRKISPEQQAHHDEVQSFIKDCTAIPNGVDTINIPILMLYLME